MLVYTGKAKDLKTLNIGSIPIPPAMKTKIELPLYRKIWWEGDVKHDGTATMLLMAFNGEENLILETHENIEVIYEDESNN
jgi:hypothetical protein